MSFRLLSWTLVLIAVQLTSVLLERTEMLRSYHVYWPDVFGMYAFLAVLGFTLAGLAVLVLSGIERAATRAGLDTGGTIADAFGWVLFVVTWSEIARQLLASNGIMIGRRFLGSTTAALALVGYARFHRAIRSWLAEVSTAVRPVAATCVLAAVAGALWFFAASGPRVAPPVAFAGDAARRPNVVIIVADSLTRQDMSLYGYPLPTTPKLDRLSGDWTVYEHALASQTRTFAMMPALLTGRYPYFDDWYQYGDLSAAAHSWMNLPQVLQQRGYETVHLVGPGYSNALYHFQEFFDRTIDEDDWVPGRRWLTHTAWDCHAFTCGIRGVGPVHDGTFDEVYDAAIAFVRERGAQTDRPFLLYVHTLRPHSPFLGGEEMGRFLPIEAGLTTAASQERAYDAAAPADAARLRLRYDEDIRKADDRIGWFLAEFRRLRAYDNSLIIITADHGTTFSPFAMSYVRKLALGSAEHDVPLLVKYPRQTAGVRVAGIVSHVDVLPTVLDAVGAKYPADWVDGRSLLGSSVPANRVAYVRRPNTERYPADTDAALCGDMKLVDRAGVWHLFDIRRDPDERDDLLAKSAVRNDVKQLMHALREFEARAVYLREHPAAVQSAPALVTELSSATDCVLQ